MTGTIDEVFPPKSLSAVTGKREDKSIVGMTPSSDEILTSNKSFEEIGEYNDKLITLLESNNDQNTIHKNNPSLQWLYSFQNFVRSDPAASDGMWIVGQLKNINEEETSCINTCFVHINESFSEKENSNKKRRVALWRFKLWSIALSMNSTDAYHNDQQQQQQKQKQGQQDIAYETTKSATEFILEHSLDLFDEASRSAIEQIKISIGSLERSLIPCVEEAFNYFSKSYDKKKLLLTTPSETEIYRCGLYSLSLSNPQHTTTLTDSDDNNKVKIRKLTKSDAELVNSRWEYRSPSSLQMIKEMIGGDESSNTSSLCCLGVEDITSGVLCAWVLQYKDLKLGMLWCEEQCRRRGYTEALVKYFMKEMLVQGQANIQAYIVDGNIPSERLFTIKLGWERITSCDWLSFSFRISSNSK